MYDSATIAALQSGALVLQDFLTLHGWDGDGDPAEFDFWTGPDNVTVNVVSAVDGSTDSRNYIGGGSLLEVPPIVDGIGLEARVHEFTLNHLHASVADMIRGNTIRLAVAELQRGLRSAATGALVSTPFPRLLGRVDGATIETGAAGSEGRLRLSVVSDAIDLSRTNPALKSDEQQKLRGGDRFRRYADAAAAWEVWWGQAKGNAG